MDVTRVEFKVALHKMTKELSVVNSGATVFFKRSDDGSRGRMFIHVAESEFHTNPKELREDLAVEMRFIEKDHNSNHIFEHVSKSGTKYTLKKSLTCSYINGRSSQHGYSLLIESPLDNEGPQPQESIYIGDFGTVEEACASCSILGSNGTKKLESAMSTIVKLASLPPQLESTSMDVIDLTVKTSELTV